MEMHLRYNAVKFNLTLAIHRANETSDRDGDCWSQYPPSTTLSKVCKVSEL